MENGEWISGTNLVTLNAKFLEKKKEKLRDKLITVQSRTCDKYVGF